MSIPRIRIQDTKTGTLQRSSANRGESLYRDLRASLYEPLMAPLERRVFAELRARQLCDLRGTGLEVGIGTGLSVSHYAPEVRLYGVEPMLEMARQAARKIPTSPLLAVVRASGERLPFADQAFDFVVGQFVCCSVASPLKTLREIHRVLKPGGRLRLLEHVRSSNSVLGAIQDRLAPLWRRCAFDCRLSGNIREPLASSPFREIQVQASAAGILESIDALA